MAPEGRLPDGANGEPQHLRTVFGRMGFNDREIVALSGAHSVGRMHKDRSGFEGQWTPSPLLFNNEYFQLLLTRTWEADDNAKPRSFSDGKGNTMMPSDMALVKDEAFRAIVLEYASARPLSLSLSLSATAGYLVGLYTKPDISCVGVQVRGGR